MANLPTSPLLGLSNSQLLRTIIDLVYHQVKGQITNILEENVVQPLLVSTRAISLDPLGRGFFSGIKACELADGDWKKTVPRFQAENWEKNKAFYDQLVAIGAKKNVTPGQLALAWVHHQGKSFVPVPGTTKKKNLQENIGALAVKLTPEELKEIEEAVPHEEIAGDRYGEMMQNTWHFTSPPSLATWGEK